jgi:chemotaxis protein histidine kinase CheA
MNEQNPEQKMDAARARMAELAEKFLERTHGDIASMRSGLARMASGDTNALGDIQHLAHRMVGTGATLGFESLSGLAHHLEKLTEDCGAVALPDESARRQLADALDALERDFRKQRGS